jgi:hypothetical protein
MPFHPLSQFVTVLQTAIGPALLISGVGLLLLTLVNRLNHITDRTRSLVDQLHHQPGTHGKVKAAQLAILWRRARLIRLSIVFASASALFAALLIVILFLSSLFGIEDAWLIGLLFVTAMAALILALLCFISDINQSLKALRLELEHAGCPEL